MVFHRFKKWAKYKKDDRKEVEDIRYVSHDLEENMKWLKEEFQCCSDVRIITKEIEKDGEQLKAIWVYCEGLSDVKRINREAIPAIQKWISSVSGKFIVDDVLPKSMSFINVTTLDKVDQIVDAVFNGKLVLFFEGFQKAIVLDVADPPRRKPEETNTERSIRGPRDGFVENIDDNISLIRRRLKTKTLRYELFVIGKRSKTKVGLLYLSDVINMDFIQEVRQRLSQIEIDVLISSNQLEELLTDSPFTLFPIFDYAGRPDFVVDSLLRGRFCLVIDGSPTVSIAPANLTMLLKSSEDHHNFFTSSSLGGIIRGFGFATAIFLPAFWVSLSGFHQDEIPISLLATVVESRRGVPFPTPIEAFLMLVLFELFREAGMRIPSALGQSISVVGGLIVGDAAIRSGLTSPSMVVVIAISTLSGISLVNQSITGIITILRFFSLFLSSILGIFGFLIAIFLITLYLSTIKSFGVPYLAPMSPFSWRDFIMAFTRPNFKIQKRRADILSTRDKTRMRESP